MATHQGEHRVQDPVRAARSATDDVLVAAGRQCKGPSDIPRESAATRLPSCCEREDYGIVENKRVGASLLVSEGYKEVMCACAEQERQYWLTCCVTGRVAWLAL